MIETKRISATNKEEKVIILNGKIISPFNLISGKTILCQDGIIRSIENREDITVDNTLEVIDSKNNFVAPDYIDLHVHGGGGSDFIDGECKGIDQIAITHSRFGTTAFLPTAKTNSKNKIIKSLKNIYESFIKGTGAAEISGVQLEGPYSFPE